MEHGLVIGRRQFVRGAALATGGLLLNACTSGEVEATTTAAASNEEGGPSGELRDLTGLTVGAVLETLSHPLINAWGTALETEGQGFGMQVTVQDGERNVERQTSQMEAFITQGADYLVLQATDAAGLSPVVDEAEAAGIPVVTLNQDVATPHTGFVGMGHYAMGVGVAEGLAAQIGESGNNIVIIEGVQGTGANIERLAGFMDQIENYDWEIVSQQAADFDRRRGHDVFETILQGQDQIDGVFALSDEMAIGAGQAAEEAGRSEEMRIWGADGALDMFNAIREGATDGTSAVNVLLIPQTIMYIGAWLLSAGVSGGRYAGAVELPPYNVTIENVDEVAQPPA